MKIHKRLINITHSFLAKLIGLVITLAFTIILIITLFGEFIISDELRHFFFFLIAVIGILFSIAIYFIHRLLLPVKELSHGVKEISKGNLDVRINVKSKDELGKLAEAFNQMAKDLKTMIESREQLLLDVSHELRTPITRSRLALEMVDESEYICTAKRNLREVETMIKELLESERLRNGFNNLNISKIDIKDLLGQLGEEYSGELPGVKVNPISEGLYIDADKELMKIVFRNVIENAFKYSPDNSSPVELSVIDNDDNIIVQVEDFGQGLNPNDIEKVFEPFYRTDKSRSRKTGGYGLGLHLCKKIMGAHGGEIKIYNKEKGHGLIVEIKNKKT